MLYIALVARRACKCYVVKFKVIILFGIYIYFKMNTWFTAASDLNLQNSPEARSRSSRSSGRGIAGRLRAAVVVEDLRPAAECGLAPRKRPPERVLGTARGGPDWPGTGHGGGTAWSRAPPCQSDTTLAHSRARLLSHTHKMLTQGLFII
jgi:hypothetical protein